MIIPDSIDPIIAFRAWNVVDGKLTSVAAQKGTQHWMIGRDGTWFINRTEEPDYFPWRKGKNRAACHAQELGHIYPPGEHSVPDPECACGFWGFSTTLTPLCTRLVNYMVLYRVFGWIEMWGKVVIGSHHGYRSEFARPVALMSWKSKSWSRLGKMDSYWFGFPPLTALSQTDLEPIAERYGIPIVDRMKVTPVPK